MVSLKFHMDVLNAFLGNFGFQSEQFYFIDKPKKQEIRVRNGNTYFYEDVSIYVRFLYQFYITI